MVSRVGGSRASAGAPFSREGEWGAETGKGISLLSTVVDKVGSVWVISVVRFESQKMGRCELCKIF